MDSSASAVWVRRKVTEDKCLGVRLPGVDAEKLKLAKDKNEQLTAELKSVNNELKETRILSEHIALSYNKATSKSGSSLCLT